MKRTDLTTETLTADTEFQLFIPPGTRRIEFSTPSAFPTRVSFVQGEVAGGNLGGFLVTNGEDTLKIGRFDGPIFFSSEQPHALMDVHCWSSQGLVSTAETSGAFSTGFGPGFDIGQ